MCRNDLVPSNISWQRVSPLLTRALAHARAQARTNNLLEPPRLSSSARPVCLNAECSRDRAPLQWAETVAVSKEGGLRGRKEGAQPICPWRRPAAPGGAADHESSSEPEWAPPSPGGVLRSPGGASGAGGALLVRHVLERWDFGVWDLLHGVGRLLVEVTTLRHVPTGITLELSAGSQGGFCYAASDAGPPQYMLPDLSRRQDTFLLAKAVQARRRPLGAHQSGRNSRVKLQLKRVGRPVRAQTLREHAGRLPMASPDALAATAPLLPLPSRQAQVRRRPWRP